MRVFSCVLLLNLWISASCTSNEEGFSDVVEAYETDDDDDYKWDTKVRYGLAPYKYQGREHKLPWVSCDASGLKRYFFMIIANSPDFKSPEKACKSGVIEGIMGAGYAVFAFHLPGYGGATGNRDFGGVHSKYATSAIMESVKLKYKKDYQIYGMWGYGEASVALLFFAKNNPKIPLIVVGGGIYDMEVVVKRTKNALLKETINSLLKTKGEKALESRSIAWEPSGLPNRVILYHAEKDGVFPKVNAVAFRDSLASLGNKVSLSIIPGIGHRFSEKLHRSVLNNILKKHVGLMNAKN